MVHIPLKCCKELEDHLKAVTEGHMVHHDKGAGGSGASPHSGNAFRECVNDGRLALLGSHKIPHLLPEQFSTKKALNGVPVPVLVP